MVCLLALSLIKNLSPPTNVVFVVVGNIGVAVTPVRPEPSPESDKALRPPKTGFVITKANERLGYAPKTLKESLNYLS